MSDKPVNDMALAASFLLDNPQVLWEAAVGVHEERGTPVNAADINDLLSWICRNKKEKS